MRLGIESIVLFALAAQRGAYGLGVLETFVDQDTGAFRISVDGQVWFAGDGSGVFVRHHMRQYSTDDNTLSVTDLNVWKGDDAWGVFEEYSLTYGSFDESFYMMGNIRAYERMVTFEQFFLTPLNETSSGDADGLISSFPVFTMKAGHVPSLSCQWTSWDYDLYAESSSVEAGDVVGVKLTAPGWNSPTCRGWGPDTSLSGGLAGTGPLVVFDDAASDSFVISPMQNTMAINMVSPTPGTLAFGVMGNVTSVDEHFAVRVVMTLGEGVNQAMSDWGRAMRQWTGKPTAGTARSMDVTLQYLGYTTDNGAFYYYNTADGLNYQDTIAAVKEYADEVGLPYRYVLLDSWWYEHGPADGVKNWSAQPEIFPQGMSAVYEATGWLVQAHNRWWDPSTVYAKENGGDWEFVVDEERGGAMPLQQAFWDDFLAHKAAWGLRVYEQDWLGNEFSEKVGAALEDATLARRWLIQMGEGARKNGITIQYCMPYARHLLQSLEIPAVTQARASDDYKPGNTQWQQLGGQSVLMDALGLAPSKDGFWSTSYQPGSPYQGTPNDHEPYPQLEAVVLALSAGPIAVADAVGHSDASLVLRSCMADGRLLQPSQPAKLIDRAFLHRALKASNRSMGDDGLEDGEVWAAWSHLGGRRFGYLFAANFSAAIAVTPSDLTSTDSTAAPSRHSETNRWQQGGIIGGEEEVEEEWVIVDVKAVLEAFAGNDGNHDDGGVGTGLPADHHNNHLPQEEPHRRTAIAPPPYPTAVPFSASQPLSLSPMESSGGFHLYAVLPVEASGWSLLGEVNKWVGMASVRYLEVTTTPDSMLVEVVGPEGEGVHMGFVHPNGTILVATCTLGEEGTAKIIPEGCF